MNYAMKTFVVIVLTNKLSIIIGHVENPQLVAFAVPPFLPPSLSGSLFHWSIVQALLCVSPPTGHSLSLCKKLTVGG